MASSTSNQAFTYLETAVEIGALSLFDLEFSKMLFLNHPEVDEMIVGLVCHLTKSAREGHLCVKLKNQKLIPSPVEMWLRDCSEEPSVDLIQFINQLPQAFNEIPSEFLTIVNSDLSQYPDQPICRFENSIYLQKNWMFETHFLIHLKKMLSRTPELVAEDQNVLEELSHSSLNHHQIQAVLLAFRHSLSVICGGPGTGKTHTAGTFVSIFTKIFQNPNLRIALTAPTGKAASKLRSSLGEISHAQVEALTLHSLLNLSPDSPYDYPPKKHLPFDLIIVDECSMIDVKLMASLLPAIKKGARVILLGDPDQLPSVEAGSLFSDMINHLDSSFVMRLHECLRVELQDLVSFGKEINQGTISCFPDCVCCINPTTEQPWKMEEELIGQVMKNFPVNYSVKETESVFQAFRILSPLRNSLMGVDKLNDKLLYLVHQKIAEGAEYAVPIMITKNHPKRELFNGETGLLVRKRGVSAYSIEEDDYALFNERKIPALLLPPFEFAFCMSVHKSQGSEFEHVFLALPKGSEWFGREMLYTAVTRAKKKLTIYGDQSVIEPTLKNHCQRSSGVGERLVPLV